MNLVHVDNRACIDFHGISIERAYEPFAHDAFTPLFASFAEVEPTKPLRLTLTAIDEPYREALGPDWRPSFCYGVIQAYTNDGVHVLTDGYSLIEVRPRSGQMLGRLFERNDFDISSGMQHIALSLLLRQRGVFDAHAATACTGTRGLTILGDSGAGKTTLLLSLMAIGCEFLGDDRLLFRAVGDGVDLLSYPREFRLTTKTVTAFPELSRCLIRAPRGDGKHPIQPLEVWADQYRRSWHGETSLLLPRIERKANTSIRLVNSAEAFGKLLASSAAVVVDGIEHREEQFDSLRRLANCATAFEVVLGEDLLTDPREVARRLVETVEKQGNDR